MLGVRDPNPLVAVAALKAPGMSDSEVVRIAGMRNVAEDVLREIANSKEWTRVYQVKFNLVREPAHAVRPLVEVHHAPPRQRPEDGLEEQGRPGRRADRGEAAAESQGEVAQADSRAGHSRSSTTSQILYPTTGTRTRRRARQSSLRKYTSGPVPVARRTASPMA